MSTDPPSRAQLRYLKNLGYTGKRPRTKGQASAAIDEMLRSGSSRKAEKAIDKERELEEDEAELDNERSERPTSGRSQKQPWYTACCSCFLIIIIAIAVLTCFMSVM